MDPIWFVESMVLLKVAVFHSYFLCCWRLWETRHSKILAWLPYSARRQEIKERDCLFSLVSLGLRRTLWYLFNLYFHLHVWLPDSCFRWLNSASSRSIFARVGMDDHCMQGVQSVPEAGRHSDFVTLCSKVVYAFCPKKSSEYKKERSRLSHATHAIPVLCVSTLLVLVHSIRLLFKWTCFSSGSWMWTSLT